MCMLWAILFNFPNIIFPCCHWEYDGMNELLHDLKFIIYGFWIIQYSFFSVFFIFFFFFVYTYNRSTIKIFNNNVAFVSPHKNQNSDCWTKRKNVENSSLLDNSHRNSCNQVWNSLPSNMKYQTYLRVLCYKKSH